MSVIGAEADVPPIGGDFAFDPDRTFTKPFSFPTSAVTISVPRANIDPASRERSGSREWNILGGDLWQCVSLF